MKKILYIGNKLSTTGKTPTGVETLGVRLNEIAKVVTTSDKARPMARMYDMWCTLYRLWKDVDYVLIDTYSTTNFYYAFCAALACRRYGIKYIPILHGGNLPHRLKKSPFLCRQLFRHSYLNIAPSAYIQEAFQKQGYPNVQVIPNYLDVDKYVFTPRTELIPPHLLWVRSFDRTYNPEMAVEVLALLKPTYPQATLTMVGPDKDGSMETTQNKAEAYDLQVPEDVCFTGKLTREEWRKMSKTHNIFINTTHTDNTPVSVMEAMLLGLPVVSTNVGGIPYLITDGVDGCLVKDNDAQAMAQQIIQWAAHPEIAEEIAQNARKKAATYDWQFIKKQWCEVLQITT